AMTIGGAIAGVGGGLYAHYTTHIEHTSFNILVATFAIAYPIVGGLASVFGTLAAVVFVQGFLIEGLRFLGDWRNLLFGALIVLAMNLRPRGLIAAAGPPRLCRIFGPARPGLARAGLAALRRRARRRRARPDGRRGRDRGADRTQRVGQEHDGQPGERPLPAHFGNDPVPRRRPRSHAGAQARRPRDRAHVPEHP